MKAVRICIFALLFASIAFAEGAAQDKSHYFGGRFAFGFDYVWDNAPVRGTFGSAKDGVGEAALGNFAGLGIEIGASYMYRLNGFVGFVGEAEFSMAWFRLDEDVYSIPPEEPYGDQTNFGLYVYRFAFPVLVRVVPISKFYLEAGAQFNLNVDGDIASIEDDGDESFDFDVEPLGWSLVFGGGVFSYNPQNNLLWSAGIRLAIDMTRIEKEGIVEIRKGAAYREASPMKFWNFQCDLAFYF